MSSYQVVKSFGELGFFLDDDAFLIPLQSS